MSAVERDARVLAPVNVLFLLLERKAKVQVWLAEDTDTTLYGTLSGFDEFMNVVLVDAEQRQNSSGTSRVLGKLMLKGDCISMISHAD